MAEDDEDEDEKAYEYQDQKYYVPTYDWTVSNHVLYIRQMIS